MTDTKIDRPVWPPPQTAPKQPSAGPSFHPESPVMNFEAYGVKLEFCEDGDVIAEGHHSTQRFVAAANKVARADLGLRNIWDDPYASYGEVAEGVAQVWAVRLPKCDCTPEQIEARSCTGEHDQERDPGYWRIAWSVQGVPVTADTPGAGPYTIGRW